MLLYFQLRQSVMTAMRTARLCSLGRMTGKNVSVMEWIRVCVQCHGKQRLLDTGSQFLHTHNTTTHTQSYIFIP
jgi:hypothetical protein